MSSLSLPIPAPTGGRGLSLIAALGVTQVAGYGGLYYAFAVLAPKMTESFGWSSEWTYGGFALGLCVGERRNRGGEERGESDGRRKDAIEHGGASWRDWWVSWTSTHPTS